jgi:hypothetical protein
MTTAELRTLFDTMEAARIQYYRLHSTNAFGLDVDARFNLDVCLKTAQLKYLKARDAYDTALTAHLDNKETTQ